VAVAVAAAHFSLTLMRPATEDPDFDLAVWLAALAAVVQLLGEPVYVLADACVMYRERAAIDSAANLVRCVATYWFVVQRRGGALGFALAQLAFAAAWTAGLYALAALRARDNALRLRARGPDAALVAPFITSFASVLPGRLIDDSSAHAGRAGLLERFTDGELARLTWAFTGQSLLKLVLTEGEKSVLALVNRARPDQQGVFALVSNLGSLVARMVLQPLEESSYNDLSALLARDPQGRPLGANHALQALALVALLLKLVGLMALSFVSFGPNYSFVLFDVVYGAAWSASEAPSLLSWYCVYLMFIAVNGISEAFLAAAVSESELKGGYNRWLVVCSTLYVVGAALLLRIGLVGAVLANCLNMAARIWYSAAFFGRFCVEHQVARPWSALGEASLPPLEVFAAFAAAALATRLSFDALHVSSCGRLFPCYAAHVTVGAVALLLVAAVVLLRDRRLVSECRRVWAGRKGD
jgi:oligosaccharide translocation protein RFT1